jgi:hypothetical protein
LYSLLCYLIGSRIVLRSSAPTCRLPSKLAIHDTYLDSFEHAADLGIDLTLAWHTHGGQLSLEFLHRGLCLARPETLYTSRWYERSGSQLYVNRGIGTTVIPIRLGARPEITIFGVSARGLRRPSYTLHALCFSVATWNASAPGIDNCTSVPSAALLEIFSIPPILVARSRMPAKPQCPSRPSRST